jgi:hypothetical protein
MGKIRIKKSPSAEARVGAANIRFYKGMDINKNERITEADNGEN